MLVKNNKGVTLVELLAVTIILTSIALVAVSSITSSLYRRESKECEEQVYLALNAAKIYFSLNETASCSGQTGLCVNIKTLKNNNYFNDSNKISRLKNNSKITISSDKTKYLYDNVVIGSETNFNNLCKSS